MIWRSCEWVAFMFLDLATAISRWLFRPSYHETLIASYTGEHPIDVRDRLRNAMVGRPHSLALIMAIDLARVRSGTSRTLTEMLEDLWWQGKLR